MADRRAALAALDGARPVIARLDQSADSAAMAAGLAAAWSSAEAALAALVGSDDELTGQALIREARQRQLIAFDEANALAEFLAARDRAAEPGYAPTPADVNAARTAFLKLESNLIHDNSGIASKPVTPAQQQRLSSAAGSLPPVPPPSGSRGSIAPPSPAVARASTPVSAAPEFVAPTPRPAPRRTALWVALGVVVAIAIAGFVILHPRTTSREDALQRGMAAYSAGQRPEADSQFKRAEQEAPTDPRPHVYLGRMAREDHNYAAASDEIQTALRLDPSNEDAMREMGSLLLAQGNYELARSFYVHAVQTNPTDSAAMGWLGCSLARLGRASEASSWQTRAGAGPWDACVRQ